MTDTTTDDFVPTPNRTLPFSHGSSMISASIRRGCCCSLLLLTFTLSLLTADVSCLALRVDGGVSSPSSPPLSSQPASALVINSIRQKGGNIQRISWKEPDHNNNKDLSLLTSLATKPASINSIRLAHFLQFRSLQTLLRSTFLPASYPQYIPSGYLRYAIWSWTQDWSTQLRSVLATQRVLQGVGVGRADATALSALYNFMLRDGCGMLATLVFTAVASSNFGTNIKQWRLFADIMVDIGITLEVLATGVSRRWFLPMICVGNMCKAVCGVAAGACAGAINLHWATPPTTIATVIPARQVDANDDDDNQNDANSPIATTTKVVVQQAPPPNIADIQAKFNAQHTVTASLGLVMAAWFAKSVSGLQHSWYLGILYTALTVLHLYANIQCLRSLALTSFNPTRFEMVVDHFMEWWYSSSQRQEHGQQQDITAGSHSQPSIYQQLPSLPSPNDIAKTEPLLLSSALRFPAWTRKSQARLRRPRVLMGISFPDWWQFVSPDEKHEFCDSVVVNSSATFTTQDLLQRAKNQLARQNYLLAFGGGNTQETHTKHRSNIIAIAVGTNATARQMAKAYLEAHVLFRNRCFQKAEDEFSNPKATDGWTYTTVLDWERSAEWQHMWQIFQASCAEAGWNLDATQLPTSGYHIEWLETGARGTSDK